ncbi:hypothetical protein AVEN_219254-1 [Araneus ventricosus]|uniref:Uncharacterized protein n=1 Tax=Araneus ventricosus TaxID=182803 RepID=A0A4Y2L5M4_ARAVE|nr:hypothetical protein AVEN_219254-1 [Araneus ventricosus]
MEDTKKNKRTLHETLQTLSNANEPEEESAFLDRAAKALLFPLYSILFQLHNHTMLLNDFNMEKVATPLASGAKNGNGVRLPPSLIPASNDVRIRGGIVLIFNPPCFSRVVYRSTCECVLISTSHLIPRGAIFRGERRDTSKTSA